MIEENFEICPDGLDLSLLQMYVLEHATRHGFEAGDEWWVWPARDQYSDPRAGDILHSLEQLQQSFNLLGVLTLVQRVDDKEAISQERLTGEIALQGLQ